MTARHPLDCYLTPPCVALAVHAYLCDRAPEVLHEPWLDPFSGPGRFVAWVVAGTAAPPLALLHAWDLDPRWRRDLSQIILPARTRLGVDTIDMPWVVAGRAVNIATNHPYGCDAAVRRLHDQARVHGRWALGVVRTDWWQHPGRFEALRPDAQLQLGWRPAFGFRADKAGRIALGTDRFTGYTVSVWRPERAPRCELEVLTRPDVPRALKHDHKVLARHAYALAHEGAS